MIRDGKNGYSPTQGIAPCEKTGRAWPPIPFHATGVVTTAPVVAWCATMMALVSQAMK